MAWWLYPFFTRVQRWSKPSFHSCILWPLNMGWNASCIELVAPAAPPPPPPPPPLQPPSLFSRDTLRIRDSKLFLLLLWDEEGIFKIHTCQLCKRFWPLHCLSTVFNIISIKRYLAQESLPALVVVCLLVVGATGHSDNCLNFCSFFGLVLCPIWTQSVKQNHRVLHTMYFEGHESEAKCKEHNKSYERSTSLSWATTDMDACERVWAWDFRV